MYCSLDHDADACTTDTGGGTAGGQQAPEELVDECNSTNNYDNGTNQDCINLYQSSRGITVTPKQMSVDSA